MKDLLQKTITISDVQIEERKISVFDENKKKYSIWRTKKDGQPTKAFQAFEPYVMQATGKRFDIQHDETPVPENANAFYRTIMTIRPSTASATQTDSQPNQTVSGKELLERIKSLELRLSVLEGKSTHVTPENASSTQIEGNTGTLQPDSTTGTELIGDDGKKIVIPF